MNNPQQSNGNFNTELIRATIKSSMLEVTNQFRNELVETLKLYYNREMVDRFNDEHKAAIADLRNEIEALKHQDEKTNLSIDKLWENTFVRVALMSGAIYTIIQIWQSLSHH